MHNKHPNYSCPFSSSVTELVLHREYYHAHKCEHPSFKPKMKKHGIYSWSLITVWCGILLVSRPSHYCAVLLGNDIFISELADMIKMQKNAEELWIAVSALTTGQLSHGCSCSHNKRMQRQHIYTNPWEPVLKYTYSFIFYDCKHANLSTNLKNEFRRKTVMFAWDWRPLKKWIYSTHYTGFQICSNQTQQSGHTLWTPHKSE